MTEECGNCKFWLIFPIDVDRKKPAQRGACRRHPPVIDAVYVYDQCVHFNDYENEHPVDGTFPEYWAQPSTWYPYWCGEYKPVKKSPINP